MHRRSDLGARKASTPCGAFPVAQRRSLAALRVLRRRLFVLCSPRVWGDVVVYEKTGWVNKLLIFATRCGGKTIGVVLSEISHPGVAKLDDFTLYPSSYVFDHFRSSTMPCSQVHLHFSPWRIKKSVPPSPPIPFKNIFIWPLPPSLLFSPLFFRNSSVIVAASFADDKDSSTIRRYCLRR